MKLYEDDIAPNCRRVRIFLAEKDIEIAGEKISIGAGENLTDAYKAINPHGLLPVLELDGGAHIWESTAICRYLEALHPEPRLMGADPLETATIEMWERRADFDGMGAVAECFRNAVPFFVDRGIPGRNDVAQIPALVDRGKARTEAFFRHMDRRLGETEYLAGDRFTNADIVALCVTDFATFAGMAVPEDCLNTQRWHDAVSARPSAKAWPSMAEVAARAQAD